MSQEDPVELIKRTIRSYLEERCRDLLSYISISMQKRVRIALRAMYRFYRSTEQYPRLIDALREALSRDPDLLNRIGFEIVSEESEEFLVASSDVIKRLCEERRI